VIDTRIRPFREVLRELRLAAGLSREKLAERAGLSVKAIAALERGDRTAPRASTVGLLADALSLDARGRAELRGAAGLTGPLTTTESTPLVEPAARLAPRLKLPIPPLPLIGRKAECAQGCALLVPAAEAPRLVTLSGPGGVGKTRLALEMANQVGGQYRDGAVFVDLAPVRDQRLVPATIAYALEVHESGGRSARDLLLAALEETGGAPDLPERQQSLRQTLAWSHDLLGPAAQVLYRRLAVFAGGWTLEVAEAICAGAV